MNPTTPIGEDKISGITYFMGCDFGGYDKTTFTICVCGNDSVIVYSEQGDNKGWAEKEVKRLAEYYNISERNIKYEEHH